MPAVAARSDWKTLVGWEDRAVPAAAVLLADVEPFHEDLPGAEAGQTAVMPSVDTAADALEMRLQADRPLAVKTASAPPMTSVGEGDGLEEEEEDYLDMADLLDD
jgi:hypothetical protein